MDKCDCAEKGYMILSVDVRVEWITETQDSKRRVVGQRRIHEPCGKEIEMKAYVVK